MLRPICSMLGCPRKVVAQVFYGDGGGTARYCASDLRLARVRSARTLNPKNRIVREVKL